MDEGEDKQWHRGMPVVAVARTLGHTDGVLLVAEELPL